MEYTANVLKRAAEHVELTPGVKEALIVKLNCSLVVAKGRVRVTEPDLFSAVLGAVETIEEFNCYYGLNADVAKIFLGTDLVFVAHDEIGQPRAFRLWQHPFFVGTLFQPERKALTGTLHTVVRAFLDAAGA